jgi:hypothetical protein
MMELRGNCSAKAPPGKFSIRAIGLTRRALKRVKEEAKRARRAKETKMRASFNPIACPRFGLLRKNEVNDAAGAPTVHLDLPLFLPAGFFAAFPVVLPEAFFAVFFAAFTAPFVTRFFETSF